MARYLVIFTTPVEGGWSTAYPDAAAVVEDTDGTMPYGYQPEEINGLPVQEIKYIVMIHDVRLGHGDDMPFIVAGEYDKSIPLKAGEATIIQDESFDDDEPHPLDADIDTASSDD